MFAQVIVDIAVSEVDKIFEYSFTDERIVAGSRVMVPFGKLTVEGIVIGVKKESSFPLDRIKPITELLDSTPALTEEMLCLCDYICKKYYVSRALALRLFLPVEMRKGKVREQFNSFVLLNEGINVEDEIGKLKTTAKKQKQAILYIQENGKTLLSITNELFGDSAVKALINKNVFAVVKEKHLRSPYKELSFKNKNIVLTDRQSSVVNGIENTDKQVSLLFGVTGSGKTEVYFELIERAIKQGKTAIMLVPEIALTPQMFKGLRARFGDTAAILHSGLSNGERFDEWWRLRSGEAKIAIGARSAIFAPLENLGIIVIDEEHDGSYTSESTPRYSTIDVATMRAEYNDAKVVIGSATPSVDSFLMAKEGEYNLFELPERINKRKLPDVEIVDMRSEIRRGNNSPFSSALIDELKDCLEKGNQAMIFLNQRGYSKTVICTECGHVQKCNNCDVSLVYHKEDNALLCHYCGAKYKMITACTECGSPYIRYGGIGTERVVFELNKLFPQAKILRMDRDTTQNKEGHFKILSEFVDKKADILVGTQMIAKGHDFPSVTLVGILDADASLHFSDYRSAERTFQLITQVAGRSGRAEDVGKVVLQTYSPDNEILFFATRYDYENFFEHENAIRKATWFPPYTKIVRVLVSGEKEEETVLATKSIYGELEILYRENKDKFRFFGCMKAPLKKLQSKFRYQVLMRITDEGELTDKIFAVSDKYNNKNISVYMEINPNNLT